MPRQRHRYAHDPITMNSPPSNPTPNPYQPPLAQGRPQAISSGQREFLRAIAGHQKGLRVCLLARAVLELGFLSVYQQHLEPILITEAVLILATVYFVARAGVRLYGRFSGYYYAFVSITPFLGIFILMTVNRATTLVLRHHGIYVGLLGAVRSEI